MKTLSLPRRPFLRIALLAALAAGAGLAQAQSDPAADLRMAEEAAPSRALAEAFAARAMANERDAVLGMLSPALVARMGEASAARAIDTQILPFFRAGRGVGRSTTVTRTTDANGAAGFAYYQWLESRDGGTARPFTLYVVREQGRWVIANVVPDRLVAGRHL